MDAVGLMCLSLPDDQEARRPKDLEMGNILLF